MYSIATPMFLSLALSIGAFAAGSVAETVASLKLAPSQVDRIKVLNDHDFVFDFLHPPNASGESNGGGGHSVAASASNMPALIANGMAMTIGFLGPCGLNVPHTHPRATEFNFAVNGTLQTGFLAENGARFVFNEVPPGSATVFPKGAIHFEMNNGCEDMIFVAAFNDEDPGVDNIAQRYFGLPPAFVAASLGDIGVEEVAGLEAKIPDNIAQGTDECLKRCGITRADQPTLQRQPRVAANALPQGFSGPAPPSDASPASTASTTSASQTSSVQGSSSSRLSSNLSINDKNGKPDVAIIALTAAVGVLALGYIVLAVVYLVRRNREKKRRTKGGMYVRAGGSFAPAGAIYEAEKGAPFQSYEPSSTAYDPVRGDQ